MTIPFYLISLGLAGGLLGVWARRVLVSAGLLSGFESGLLAVAVVAFAYMALELGFMGLVRLSKPTRSPLPLLFDMAAQCAALLLLPWLLHTEVPWPWQVLHKIEPLIWLGAFAGVHGFLKLVVFFSAMQSRPGGRAGALGFLALAAAAGMGAFTAQQVLAATAMRSLSVAGGEARAREAGGAWVAARELREGLGAHITTGSGPAGDMMLLAALPEGAEPLETAHLTVVVHAADAVNALPARHQLEADLSGDGWAETRIPAALLPEKVESVEVFWTSRPAPPWLQKTGLQPLASGSRVLLLGGPWFVSPEGGERGAPQVVMVAVDGLSAENMSLHGYQRETTPLLKAWAQGVSVFEQAYTPAPEAPAAIMSLFTGLNPLRHGYFEGRQGPLPGDAVLLPELFRKQGFLTAAFTEGRGIDTGDLTADSGINRGFMLFDDTAPVDAAPPAASAGSVKEPPKPLPGSSKATLDRASAWLAAHPKEPCLLFVRLRELEKPLPLARYGEGFLGRGRKPEPVDVYDTVLLDLDRHLGAFLEQINSMPGGENRIVVLTAPHGADFSEPGRASWRRGGAGKKSLHESCLHVPLLMRLPGQAPRARKSAATLCDVAPTLLAASGMAVPAGMDGMDLMRLADSRDCVSMLGNPVALSVRTGRWRLTWESGMDPFTLEKTGTDLVSDFTDIIRYRNDQAPQNNLAKEPELAARLRLELRDYLTRRGAPAK